MLDMYEYVLGVWSRYEQYQISMNKYVQYSRRYEQGIGGMQQVWDRYVWQVSHALDCSHDV